MTVLHSHGQITRGTWRYVGKSIAIGGWALPLICWIAIHAHFRGVSAHSVAVLGVVGAAGGATPSIAGLITNRSARELPQAARGLLSAGFLSVLIVSGLVRAFATLPDVPGYYEKKLICSSPGLPWSVSVYCEPVGNT